MTVTLKNVGKSFSGKRIFSDVNLTIEPGKPIVLMGANGCGKSTLLKIITGVIPHTDGEITQSSPGKISYMPDRFPKLPFKVNDYLFHMGEIQNISQIDEYIDKMFEYLTIPGHIKTQKIPKCSKGTIQKINIMQAFMNKSDLLVMDEPFSGLDENSIERMLELIKKTALDETAKTAIILSCHESALARRITDDIYIFADGRCTRETFAD